MTETIRLNKALSILGICSRRDADRLIQTGEITVNTKTITALGSKVYYGDQITYNDKLYTLTKASKIKVWKYYKPNGLITTHRDEKNRPTVFDNIKTKISERVISVGRLDLNSEGLLLITNNADFARLAESPKTAWERKYRVRCFGTINDAIIKQLESGITISGICYAPVEVNTIKTGDGKNFWIELTLREGKNREIRKLMNYFDIQVNKLIRTKYGPYELGDLKPGQIIQCKKNFLI